MKTLLFTIIFSISLAYTQDQKSIHQIEWENHKHLKKADQNIDVLNEKIIPLQQRSLTSLNKKVFGFLPDWEYPQAMENLRFDLLTHIAAFDFHVNPDGSISNPSGWPWTDLINKAHTNGVKVILTAVNFNGSEIHTLITNETVKNNFFTNLNSKISFYNLDGVNIDFESLNNEDRGLPINNFMADLTDYIHSNFPDGEVSFDGPAVNWGSRWDFAGLANSCDYIFIMGYSFAGGWSDNSGSTAPLIGGSINITNTVLTQYAAVVNLKPEKLILGVPYYGVKFQTANSQAHSSIIDYVGSTRFRNDKADFENYGPLWDTPTASPWYRYQSGENWYQVWSESRGSMDEKFDLADSKNLLGVGMWALNYDGSQQEFWDLITIHYLDETTVINDSKLVLPNSFYLLANTPNPFNPNTKLRFYTSQPGKAKINVFDINGKLIESAEMQFAAGIQSWNWDARDSSSGIYLYSITIITHSKNKIILNGKTTLIH